jgi:hypothetical protein
MTAADTSKGRAITRLPPLPILLSSHHHAAARAEANRKPASGFTAARAFFCLDYESIANI